MLDGARIEGPPTSETHAAYRRARDSAVLIPFAAGISATWIAGSLKLTWACSTGNSKAPPIDALRATTGFEAANRLLSRAASESSSGSGGSIHATVSR
jgi:hypothetical protein